MDSTTKGSEIGLLVGTFTICPSSGCACHVYNSSMLARHTKRLPHKELPSGYSLATVHRPHYIFYGRLGEGSKEPIHTSQPIRRLLGLTDKLCQISLCGVWTDPRRGTTMLGGLGNANREFTNLILGPPIEEG